MIFYILIGFFSGVISGIGIGGGTILIPALTIMSNLNQQQIQNINLIYFIPTALIALLTHIKNRNIEKNIILKVSVFGIIGAIIGSRLALELDPNFLKKIFGFFLLLMGIYEFFKKDNKLNN